MEEKWKVKWSLNVEPECLNVKIHPEGMKRLTLEFSQDPKNSGSD